MSSENTEGSTLVAVLCFVCALLILVLRPIEACDTFWQLQSGKFILQSDQFKPLFVALWVTLSLKYALRQGISLTYAYTVRALEARRR